MLADALLIIFVTLWTIALMYIPYFLGFKQKILDDWPVYRCNPLVLPIAGWINKQNNETAAEATSDNFQYCTQNITKSLFGYLSEGLESNISGIIGLSGNMLNSINSIYGVISQIRTFFTNIIDSVMGVFINIIIEFLKIFVGIRDLAGKIVGVILTFVYMLEGLGTTGESLMNTWVGDIVCFHPDTIIQKIDGIKCKMSELSLGDKIDGNSTVLRIMKIKNIPKERFYKFKNCINNIFVTGSHLIYSDNNNGYIPVSEHTDAQPTNDIIDELCCLVTDNHIIKIGEYIFHDWEDDYERDKYKYNKMII